MELASRIAKQNDKIVQAPRGFEQCYVTLMPNGPVIVRLYEQRLFICWKSRGIYKKFSNRSDLLFRPHSCLSTAPSNSTLSCCYSIVRFIIIFYGFSEAKFYLPGDRTVTDPVLAVFWGLANTQDCVRSCEPIPPVQMLSRSNFVVFYLVYRTFQF